MGPYSDSPLFVALQQGDEQAALLMLEAVPAAAGTEVGGSFPIHRAAGCGLLAVVQRLLQLAPETAVARRLFYKETPLHCAAASRYAEVVKLLLAVAPHTALETAAKWTGSRLPLEDALLAARPRTPWPPDSPDHIEAARLLLAYTPVHRALPALAGGGDPALPLFADLVSHWPLTAAQWQAIPSPCPGLARALPAVLARSEVEAAALVAHLPTADKARLRMAALCLHRSQQTMELPLPREVGQRILALVS